MSADDDHAEPASSPQSVVVVGAYGVVAPAGPNLALPQRPVKSVAFQEPLPDGSRNRGWPPSSVRSSKKGNPGPHKVVNQVGDETNPIQEDTSQEGDAMFSSKDHRSPSPPSKRPRIRISRTAYRESMDHAAPPRWL